MTTRDPTVWMWQQACDMLDRADRMQREFFQLGIERRAVPTWQPPVDIVESDQHLTIIAALPGVRARDVDVRIDGDVLIIAALRTLPPAGSGSVIRRLEVPYGRFERRLVLESGQLQLEKRELADGCLHLTFRKIG